MGAAVKCETCAWWRAHGAMVHAVFDANGFIKPEMRDTHHGDCRRHAPALGKAAWPHVHATDFCGEHKPRNTESET